MLIMVYLIVLYHREVDRKTDRHTDRKTESDRERIIMNRNVTHRSFAVGKP